MVNDPAVMAEIHEWKRRFDAVISGASRQRPEIATIRAPYAGPLFWSPDSRFIAFGVGSQLKKIEVSGGPPQTLCEAGPVASGDWTRDGVIIFGGFGHPKHPSSCHRKRRPSQSEGRAIPKGKERARHLPQESRLRGDRF